MKNENLSELLQKYLQGNCTPEEVDFVDKWYLSAEQNPDDIRLLNSREREELERKMLADIKSRIESTSDEPRVVKFKPTSYFSTLQKVAASLILISLAGIGAFLYQGKQSTDSENQLVTSGHNIRKVTNNSAFVMEQLLADGTRIKLQPNGSIEFPEIFAESSREIQLTGEAFFDVAKDQSRPFIISTGEVTIKVLGTSFNVKAYQGAREITVAVKTGKVSVHAKTADVNPLDQTTKEGIILTPNQQVVYNTVKENFSKKLVDRPQIILDRPTLFEMQYDGTPVNEILKVVEENYGIDIVFDNEVLSACNLTTSMSEEGFYERIEIICQAIGAEYEIKDGRIVINSKGCQ